MTDSGDLYSGDLVSEATMNANWSLNSRLTVALSAVKFFSLDHYDEHCEMLGKPVLPSRTTTLPFTLGDFLAYLKLTAALPKPPNLLRLNSLLESLSSAGLIVPLGRLGRPEDLNPTKERYVTVGVHPPARRRGGLLYALALGPDVLFGKARQGFLV